MGELSEIWQGAAIIVAAVSTIVARFKATDPTKSFWERLAITFDLTQIFDSTRKIDD